MKYLKNRKTAVIIAVATAFLTLAVGVNRTLTRMSLEVESLFYDGVYNEAQGFLEQSINSQLERMAATTLNFATLMQSYPHLESEADEALRLRRELLGAETISGKWVAARDLVGAFSFLIEAAERGGHLSERDMDALEDDWRSFSGAYGYINNSLVPLYEGKINEFLEGRSFIAALISSASPEAFSSNGRIAQTR